MSRDLITLDLDDACSEQREALSAFVRNAGIDPADIVDIYSFGVEPELIDLLAELVVSGPKRATTSLLRWYVVGNERLPTVGDLALVVAGSCRPRAIVRVTRVDIKPFRDVDDEFAWDEGEGDRSLAYWREAHRTFFEAEAARADFTFDERDDVVLCRFAVIWPDTATTIDRSLRTF